MEFKNQITKVAAVNAAPIIFNLEKTIEKTLSIIDEAARNGAKIIVFPETYLPNFPWWIWMPIDSRKRLELFKKLYYEAVDVTSDPLVKHDIRNYLTILIEFIDQRK